MEYSKQVAVASKWVSRNDSWSNFIVSGQMETSAKTFWNSDKPISPVSACEDRPWTCIIGRQEKTSQPRPLIPTPFWAAHAGKHRGSCSVGVQVPSVVYRHERESLWFPRIPKEIPEGWLETSKRQTGGLECSPRRFEAVFGKYVF